MIHVPSLIGRRHLAKKKKEKGRREKRKHSPAEGCASAATAAPGEMRGSVAGGDDEQAACWFVFFHSFRRTASGKQTMLHKNQQWHGNF